MKKEYLDVVNSRNKVIGKALRSDCHQKGLWHRASHVLIIDYQGNIFSVRRAANKDISPNLWGSMGEHLKLDEDYTSAAMRGLREEMNVKSNPSLLEKILNFRNISVWTKEKKNREFVDLFIFRSNGPYRINQEEGGQSGHYPLKVLLKRKKKLTPDFYDDLIFYKNYRLRQKKLFNAFEESKFSLQVIWENKVTYKTTQKGIKPLVNLLIHKRSRLPNKIVFDKVVGRAAALLLVYAGVGEVHTEIISQEAVKVFKKYKIYHQYGKLIEHILNKDKSDVCPFEKMAKGKTPSQFYKIVRNKF